MNVQLLKKSTDLINERVVKALDVCESGAKELVSVMDNLVDVTRLRLGKLELRRTKTNVSKILINVITKFKDDIRILGISVSLTHSGDIVGYWDQARLEQLFSNLLSNAIKFGEGKPIRMELKAVGDFVIFSIEDKGPGIPVHLQNKIFERFERAVGARNISGLGLGLYVSRQIVSAHKGEIVLESAPGNGAKFIVKIPLKQARKTRKLLKS